MCRFTDSALLKGKRKASYFEDFEPVDGEAIPMPDSGKQALPNGFLDRAGSLVSLEFSRLWSLDSNSADYLGLSQAPAQTAAQTVDDRSKRDSGCSTHSEMVTCNPELTPQVSPATVTSAATAATAADQPSSSCPPAVPELPCLALQPTLPYGMQQLPQLQQQEQQQYVALADLAQAPSLPESCDMWDFTPQECPEREPAELELLDEFGGGGSGGGADQTAACELAYPALQPQQYVPPMEQQQQQQQEMPQQYMAQFQLQQQQSQLQPAMSWRADTAMVAAALPPVYCAPSPAVTACIAPPPAPVVAPAAAAAVAVPACATAGGAASGTGDFELCEKFYGSVMRLKDYAASVGIERLNPTGGDAPEGVLPGLLTHVKQVSKVCIDLFKPECPAVLAGLIKSLGATQPEVAAQRWRHVIAQMRMTEQQVLAVLGARERHLAAITALYEERADLAQVVQELVCSTGGAALQQQQCSSYNRNNSFGSSGSGGSSGASDLGRQGFLYCAHATQGLQRAMEGLQGMLVRERDLVMKLYLELMYFVLTPVQAAVFIMEAFPNHIDVLAMANILAAAC